MSEWWLIGTGYTAHWMATGIQNNTYSADLVNEFVVQAVRGGALALGLFIFLIVKCFKAIGHAVRDQGYRYVTLDLEGLRSGNLNASLPFLRRSPG